MPFRRIYILIFLVLAAAISSRAPAVCLAQADPGDEQNVETKDGTEDSFVAEKDEAKDEKPKGRRRVINIEEELSEEELALLKQQEAQGVAKDEPDLPFQIPDDPAVLPEYALVVTTKGPFEIKLFREQAIISVANFRHLVQKGIYEGLTFHRYVPGFVIQGGDPTGTEKGGPGWTLPPEMDPDIHHVRGTIGWARLSGKTNPERRSNGSQFYICLQPQPRLDGFYSAFAVVVKGIENVDRLRPGDKILKVKFPRDYQAEPQGKK